jgi:hypothetical protein
MKKSTYEIIFWSLIIIYIFSILYYYGKGYTISECFLNLIILPIAAYFIQRSQKIFKKK